MPSRSNNGEYLCCPMVQAVRENQKLKMYLQITEHLIQELNARLVELKRGLENTSAEWESFLNCTENILEAQNVAEKSFCDRSSFLENRLSALEQRRLKLARD